MENKDMKAVIVGIGPDNYNFRKLENLAVGFEEIGYDSVCVSTTSLLHDPNVSADIALIESDVPLSTDLSRFKKVVIWQNWSPSRIFELSKKNPKVDFILASKSAVHVPEFRSRYKNKFLTSVYQKCDETGEIVDLNEYENVSSPKEKLSNNVTHVYAPLTTSSDPRYLMEKDIDVVYFGTGANRPGVVEMLNSLPKNLRVAAHFVEKSGPIHPETCVSLYRRSKVCLHEQVSPVWGEFAVRFGEATAQGCRIVSLAREFNISDIVRDPLVPEHSSSLSVEEAVSEILEWTKPKKEEREHMRKSTARGSDLLNRLLSDEVSR